MTPRPVPTTGPGRIVARNHQRAHGHALNAVTIARATPGVYVLVRLCCGERAS